MDEEREAGATIYDVARAAEVVASTVSCTFSRPGLVNADTAERVRQVAEELGYRTTPQARALATTGPECRRTTAGRRGGGARRLGGPRTGLLAPPGRPGPTS